MRGRRKWSAALGRDALFGMGRRCWRFLGTTSSRFDEMDPGEGVHAQVFCSSRKAIFPEHKGEDIYLDCIADGRTGLSRHRTPDQGKQLHKVVFPPPIHETVADQDRRVAASGASRTGNRAQKVHSMASATGFLESRFSPFGLLGAVDAVPDGLAFRNFSF